VRVRTCHASLPWRKGRPPSPRHLWSTARRVVPGSCSASATMLPSSSMAPVSQRIGNIEGRLDRLDAKVDALGSEMRSLNADTVRQVRESEATLRQEMRAGDEETRRQMRDGDEETRRLMRLLHEDVIDRIKTLGDTLLPPR
jgi:hypothetical protein